MYESEVLLIPILSLYNVRQLQTTFLKKTEISPL